eukprot:2267382-Amphidinium_carterae.2
MEGPHTNNPNTDVTRQDYFAQLLATCVRWIYSLQGWPKPIDDNHAMNLEKMSALYTMSAAVPESHVMFPNTFPSASR